VAVTVADDAVVRWLAGLRVPGLLPAMRALAALGSWVAISALLYGLLAALLILRRLRQLLIVLAAWIMQGVIIQYIAAPLAQRPRPFGVVFRTGWDMWALPSEKMAALVVTLLGILYALVPEGRWRQRGKWAAAAVVLLVALAHLYLGVLAPTDVLIGVAVGVAIPLVGFRLFAPGEVLPVTYRRGSTAHLDVGGSRGKAIRRALRDQLGLVAGDVEPFGLAGSAGSTPLRIKLKGDPGTDLFGKLYARSHLRSDRWYKLGRDLLYGRLEDEKPFHTVRRLVQQEDGLSVIRKLWDAGLAHRDIKPANLLVRNDQLLLIDVAFAEARPTPWRQAVDLANMMLCLALRSR
jgi:membrane-associated phospholipid phosphatase